MVCELLCKIDEATLSKIFFLESKLILQAISNLISHLFTSHLWQSNKTSLKIHKNTKI